MFKPKIYLAQAMTGHSCNTLIAKAHAAKSVLEKAGFEVWSPVLVENVPNKKATLTVTNAETLLELWKIDKNEGLKQCHMIYDIDGDLRSEGVGIEKGYMRFYKWAPVIRRKSRKTVYSISHIEDDAIVHTHEEAVAWVKKTFPTRAHWVWWKLCIIVVGIPKLCWRQIRQLWL